MQLGDLALLVITAALLWIGWELHLIAGFALNLVRGLEDGSLRRKQETASGN